TSGEDGSYTLAGIKEGKYIIIVSFVGLQTIQQPIEIKAEQTNLLDFTLLENENELAKIVVTSQKTINQKPVTVSKIPVRAMDLPQSISIIGRDILERQQVLQLSDALQNTTGVYIMGTTGGYQEEIAGRGYSFTSSNTFKNGVRYNNAIIPEMSSVEKIEFLKGGSA